MRHVASPLFWKLYYKLPPNIQEVADKNFELLKADPKHRSLRLKKVGRYWSVRAGKKYRALGVDVDEGILWFWIGAHAEYDKMIE